MANPRQPFPPNMIAPTVSFYDPDQHEQQWESRIPTAQFDFAYPAPGASYAELYAQLYPKNQQQQEVQEPQRHPQQPRQHAQYQYPAIQSTSDPDPNIPNSNITDGPNNGSAAPATPSRSAPKRKRTAKKAVPAPRPVTYADNSDSGDGFSFSRGGGAGISVSMGGVGVRGKASRR
ncbi:hypothetical protein B0H14DRAFT_3446276 [Mycena olivaceomarginata]|nr:hypothetical protein B0H14DRAFT_3446276 [Mycena olivaceomarginata]